MTKSLTFLKQSLVAALIFLFPLFFLPLTQEYFITAKFYLLGFGVLLLLLISTVEIAVTKKFVWEKKPLDTLIIIFLLTTAVAAIISSPNKIAAILNPSFGLVALFSLSILYFYLSREKILNYNLVLNLSSSILAVITIALFFQPLRSVAKLPVGFSPIGTQIDLIIFLGFFVVYFASHILLSKKTTITNFVFLLVNLAACCLSIYSLSKQGVILPPMRISWYAAVETLKNPLTAFFGVGVDNFSTIFSQVKDVAYNQSRLWQISSFTVSRSAILHIFTETGILGLTAFLLLIATVSRLVIKATDKSSPLVWIYLMLIILLFPISLPVLFLFFIILSQITPETNDVPQPTNLDMANFVPLYLGFVVIFLALIGAGGYLLGRSYQAEYYFKQSLNALAKNNAKDLYNNQKQAVILNPFNERFRISFSQANMLLANNVASKKKEEITEQDRQAIAQAIQAAISEAKAAVTLNQKKTSSWENLANIYRNIINVATGADGWVISSWQKAITLDPQNPSYRLNLGGVYYSLGNYDEALRYFETAVTLKPNWANAYYNFAWTAYQKGDYQKAVKAMESTLTLVDPRVSAQDYEKAKGDLEEFKKKLPETEDSSTDNKQNKPNELTLPESPTTNIEPKIELPTQASP